MRWSKFFIDYYHIIVRIEAKGVDPCCMSCIFPNVFALDDIGEYDIFVSPSTDKLRVVFADIQRVNVVVVDVAVVLYH